MRQVGDGREKVAVYLYRANPIRRSDQKADANARASRPRIFGVQALHYLKMRLFVPSYASAPHRRQSAVLIELPALYFAVASLGCIAVSVALRTEMLSGEHLRNEFEGFAVKPRRKTFPMLRTYLRSIKPHICYGACIEFFHRLLVFHYQVCKLFCALGRAHGTYENFEPVDPLNSFHVVSARRRAVGTRAPILVEAKANARQISSTTSSPAEGEIDEPDIESPKFGAETIF
jgi:hypothetical protein